jgi:hypothetical protein
MNVEDRIGRIENPDLTVPGRAMGRAESHGLSDLHFNIPGFETGITGFTPLCAFTGSHKVWPTATHGISARWFSDCLLSREPQFEAVLDSRKV